MENLFALKRMEFKEIIPILEYIDSGRDLIGNYFVVNWKQENQCYLITKNLIEDERFFQKSFIEQHNLRIGIL